MWCVFIPESLFALLGCELVEGLGLLLAEEGLVVVVEVLLVVVLLVTERGVVMDSVLLLHGFGGDVSHTKRHAQQQQPEIHPACLTHFLSHSHAQERGLEPGLHGFHTKQKLQLFTFK